MGIGVGLAHGSARSLLLKKQIDLKGFFPLFWGAFIASWIGAKVFFLALSSGDNFSTYIHASNFWLGGGFVFYGGLIFGALYLLIYTVLLRRFGWQHVYLFLPGLALGHGVGRIGCFLAGCCYGKESDLLWSIHMHGVDRHPVQLYEALSLFAIAGLLHWQIGRGQKSLSVLLSYIVSYSVVRFFMEYFRGDLVRGIHWFNLSSSQIVSIVLIVSSIIYLLARSYLKRK